MTKLATFGLLATSGIGQALGAPVQSPLERGPSPAPQLPLSRAEQDMARAMDLIRRGEDPYAHIDYSNIDWTDASNYKGVDWNKITYDRGDVRGDVPSVVGSPSVYGTPPAPSPTLSSLGRAYETTFGQPSPLPTPPASNVVRGFVPTSVPLVTATPVPTRPLAVTNPERSPTPAPLLKVDKPTPQKALGASTDYDATSWFAGIDANQNAVAIKWHGEGTQTFHLYANKGPYQPEFGDAYKRVDVASGAQVVVQLPHAWSGRVQKMTGGAADPATWSEFTFNGWQDLTWFDDSYIRGYNGPVEMYLAAEPTKRAGVKEDMLKQAPSSITVNQRGGIAIKDTEGFDGTIRFDVIDFWKAHMPDKKEAYVRNFDDIATLAGPTKHLVTEWY